MSGDARVCIVGFPSVGKSTMLSRLTRTQSTASAAEFTTLTAIPGNLYYKDARIQLIDTLGIIEGAAQGKGKGRQVISIARTANLLIIMLDPTREVAQKKIIEHELNFYGIRTNAVPPDITINKKSTGLNINSTVPLTHMTHDLAKLVLHEYKIYNADVLFRCDATVDEFIDVIEGKRVYIPCIYLYNKIDRITLGEVEKFASRPHTVTISCELDLNIPYFVECIWQYLKMIRLYTKRKGEAPSLKSPLVLKSGATVTDVCRLIHQDMVERFKYAVVWGTSVKHYPQRVGAAHVLSDEDVIEIHTM